MKDHFEGYFGDRRRAMRGDQLLQQAIDRGTICVHRQGQGMPANKAAYRFYDNPRVEAEHILQAHYTACRKRLAQRGPCRVDVADPDNWLVCPSDTTEIDLSHLSGALLVNDSEVGRISTQKHKIGFLLHTMLVVDARRWLYGVARAQLWSRPFGGPDKHERNYKNLPTAAKESQRWLDDLSAGAELSTWAGGRTVVHVMDREADDYALFAHAVALNRPIVVRHCRQRRIEDVRGTDLVTVLDAVQPCGQIALRVPGSTNRRARVAKLQLRYTRVQLSRPAKQRTDLPAQLSLWVVEARETADSVPLGESPIQWILYTNIEVTGAELARWILNIYATRWSIEDYFAAVKSRGMDIESTQLRKGTRIKKQIAMSLEAAVYVRNLVAERDGQQGRLADELFNQEEQAYAELLNPIQETPGTTCVNPHPKGSLAYMAWVIARLGGWSGLPSQSPPGTKTFTWGITRFFDNFEIHQALQKRQPQAQTTNGEKDVGKD